MAMVILNGVWILCSGAKAHGRLTRGFCYRLWPQLRLTGPGEGRTACSFQGIWRL